MDSGDDVHCIIPKSPIPQGQCQTVSFFIDAITASWNRDLLEIYFTDQVVHKILPIPLGLNPGDDFICWLHSKPGV